MSTTPTPVSSTVTTFLDFVRHPGTSTGLGVTIAALSQFTAAVPSKDRTTPTLLGLGYALASQVLDWLKSATATK